MQKLSLKWKFSLLIGLCLLLSTLSSFGVQIWCNQKSDWLLTSSSQDLIALETTGQVQETFGKEVQEWKNLLLRGGDPESYKKYNASFEEAIATLTEQAKALKEVIDPSKRVLVDQFLEAQSALKNAYFSARSQFVNGSIFEPSKADQAVKGKDRQVLESLNQLSRHIVEKAHTDQEEGKKDLQIYFQIGIAVSAVLTILLLITAFLFSNHLSKTLMKITEEISGSSHEVAKSRTSVTTFQLRARKFPVEPPSPQPPSKKPSQASKNFLAWSKSAPSMQKTPSQLPVKAKLRQRPGNRK